MQSSKADWTNSGKTASNFWWTDFTQLNYSRCGSLFIRYWKKHSDIWHLFFNSSCHGRTAVHFIRGSLIQTVHKTAFMYLFCDSRAFCMYCKAVQYNAIKLYLCLLWLYNKKLEVADETMPASFVHSRQVRISYLCNCLKQMHALHHGHTNIDFEMLSFHLRKRYLSDSFLCKI